MNKKTEALLSPAAAQGVGWKGRFRNRGGILSTLSLAGSSALIAQGLLVNEGTYRLVRFVLDSLLALGWLAALILFTLRPALNRYTQYARFASRAGSIILAFALAYGAAASWFGTGYIFFSLYIVPGFVLARTGRTPRWLVSLGMAAALGAVGVASQGLRLGLAGMAYILAPLCLAEASAQAVERVRKEGEVSLRDLKSRNEELEELAYRDPLTLLYNRRYGLESLRRSLSFAHRYGGELHILILDIDHFKKVNDRQGHPVGDTVLAGLAKILESSIRDTDIAARIGGEEFLIILPRARPEHAQAVANRIRDITYRTEFESVPWRITVSIGLTGLRPEDTAESFFSRADGYLYDSKKGGRNRVTGS